MIMTSHSYKLLSSTRPAERHVPCVWMVNTASGEHVSRLVGLEWELQGRTCRETLHRVLSELGKLPPEQECV